MNDLFPFLFGRAFIEAPNSEFNDGEDLYFPSFLEGLSLRPVLGDVGVAV